MFKSDILFNFYFLKKAVLVFIIGCFVFENAKAATITSTTTGGDWATGGTWVGGAAPISTDDVVIATTGGNSVTTSAGTITCNSLVINSGAILLMNRPFVVTTTADITGSVTFASTSGTNRLMTFTGDLTLNSGATWTQLGTGNGSGNTYTISGNFINNATSFSDAGTGVHTFNGTSKTISGNTVTSIPLVAITGTIANVSTLTVSNTLSGSGTLTNNNNATLNITGSCSVTTLANSGTINKSGTANITTALANFTNTDTLNITGSGTITGITNNAGGIVNHDGSATVTSFNNATSTSTLNIGTTPTVPTITTLTATTAGNTVNYDGAGTQTIKATTYSNLTLSGSGAKTFPTGTTTVNGILSIENGTSANTFTGTLTYGASATLQYNAGASARTASTEWVTPFVATGGVIIAGTGTITLNAAKQFGSNTNVDLTINSGASMSTSGSNFALTFHGDYNNNGGTLSAGSSGVTISGTVAAQSIDGFTTTGTVTFNKGAAASVGIDGKVTAATFTYTATAFVTSLNLTTGDTLAITGTATLARPSASGTFDLNVNDGVFTANVIALGGTTAGSRTSTINVTTGVVSTVSNITSAGAASRLICTGAATINCGGTFLTSASAGTFTSGSSSTVRLNGAAQSIKPTTFQNLTLAGSGAKTFPTGTTTVNGILSIENGTNANTFTGSLAYGASATLQYNAGASNRTTSTEWVTPFIATGGVRINGTGTITLQNAKQFGNNTNVDLTIESGATLSTSGSNFGLTFHGDYINNGGTLTAGSSIITIAGTTATHDIDGFTTTGLVTMTKTSGVATATGNFNGAALTINGSGGTINMGSGLTHTFTGDVSLTNGTLNGGSSTIHVNSSSATAWTGTGSNFTASTSTVDFGGTNQTINTATTFDELTLSNSGTKTMAAAVIVGGALTQSGTAKLGIGANTLTLNGDYVGGTSSRTIIGGLSSNLTIGGNGAITSSFFFDESSDTALNNLTMNRSGGTFTCGNKLKIFGSLTPTLGTVASGGFLVIGSSAASTGNILAGSGSVTGSVAVQRFIPAIAARRFRFLSSSVSGASMADWKNEFHVTGVGSNFDGTLSNQSSAFTYDETATGLATVGWVAVTDGSNTTLDLGRGFRMFVRGTRNAGRLNGTVTTQDDITIDVNGTVNVSDVSPVIFFTSNAGMAEDGWNLIGNPFPSAFDWNAFHDTGRNGTSPDFSSAGRYSHLNSIAAIYNGSTNSYATYNADGEAVVGAFTGGIVPSGSAFLVKAVASSPSINLKESNRVSTVPGALYKGSAPAFFTIVFTKDSTNSDEMIIKYREDASENLDGFDIPKIYGPEVNIATITTDGTFLSANLKPRKASYTDTIPFSVGIRTTGNYKFDFFGLENLIDSAEIGVFLVDKFTKTYSNLRETKTYNFTADISDSNTFANNRFMIVMGKNTGVEEMPAATDHKVYLFPVITTDYTSIYSSNSIHGSVSIMVTDLLGRTIKKVSNDQWQNNQIQLDLSALNSGTYLIQVISSSLKKPVVMKCIKN